MQWYLWIESLKESPIHSDHFLMLSMMIYRQWTATQIIMKYPHWISMTATTVAMMTQAQANLERFHSMVTAAKMMQASANLIDRPLQHQGHKGSHHCDHDGSFWDWRALWWQDHIMRESSQSKPWITMFLQVFTNTNLLLILLIYFQFSIHFQVWHSISSPPTTPRLHAPLLQLRNPFQPPLHSLQHTQRHPPPIRRQRRRPPWSTPLPHLLRLITIHGINPPLHWRS